MRYLARLVTLLLIAVPCAVALEAPAVQQASSAASPPRLEVSVASEAATIGDALQTEIVLYAAPDVTLELPRIGPRLGPFTVLSGAWGEREPGAGFAVWRWTGELTIFKTGEHELPVVTIEIDGPQGKLEVLSEPLIVSVASVLEQQTGEEPPEIADLKPPASLELELGPLWTALLIIGLLLLGAAILWWLNRRYGHRLAAVEKPDDPFHRSPPHVWVYAELQRLLERRLAESGRIDEFYSEVSRILKRYLSGRYRVDLLECTTEEVPPVLRQVAAVEQAIDDVRGTLRSCDLVKFAGERPGPAEWRAIVERIYRIVDVTKPIDAASDSPRRGAA